MSSVALAIRPLRERDLPLFDAHFARHRAESGRGEPHFMPYAPGAATGPKGLKAERFSLGLDKTGWERWFAAWDESGTSIIGHVDLKGDGHGAGLHRCELGIGIERPYRRRGLGRRLMQTVIQFAREAPTVSWLDLRVFAHNHPARALYKGLGFRELGTYVDRFRVAETSIDDVMMTLSVDTSAPS